MERKRALAALRGLGREEYSGRCAAFAARTAAILNEMGEADRAAWNRRLPGPPEDEPLAWAKEFRPYQGADEDAVRSYYRQAEYRTALVNDRGVVLPLYEPLFEAWVFPRLKRPERSFLELVRHKSFFDSLHADLDALLSALAEAGLDRRAPSVFGTDDMLVDSPLPRYPALWSGSPHA